MWPKLLTTIINYIKLSNNSFKSILIVDVEIDKKQSKSKQNVNNNYRCNLTLVDSDRAD